MALECNEQENIEFIINNQHYQLNFIIDKKNNASDISCQWNDFYNEHHILLSQVGFQAFEKANLKKTKDCIYQINIILCDDDFIHTLNKDYREMDKPTNVLSFPIYDRDEINQYSYCFAELQIFGDIFIAYNYCLNEAKQHQKTFKNHIAHMLVHGILHILGYDHINHIDAEIMEGLESEILSHFMIENPYK